MKKCFALLSVVMIPVACSSASREPVARSVETKSLVLETSPEGFLVEKADLDGDGSPDVWNYYREGAGGKVLQKKAIDLNGDGRPDAVQVFDESGVLVREELDLDFDSRIDKVRFYENGKLIREEIASHFDGRVDIKKFYENGALVLKIVDSNRDGVFEEYQYFVGGKLERIGWDRDGDGKPEVFETNPAFE